MVCVRPPPPETKVYGPEIKLHVAESTSGLFESFAKDGLEQARTGLLYLNEAGL